MAVLSPEIWGYFDNGKLHTDTITNGAGTGGTVLETHTAGYETNGIYLDGNRASDAYALNGPGSTACAGSAPSCTAAYSYDARDRLTGRRLCAASAQMAWRARAVPPKGPGPTRRWPRWCCTSTARCCTTARR